MWHPELDKTLSKKIFVNDDDNVLEKPMIMAMLDMPDIQKYNNVYADKLIQVLAETDNLDIFNTTSVRAIIELKWPLVKKAMVKYLFYPYLTLLFCFIMYSVYIFEHIQDNKTEFEDVGWDFKNP